MPVTTQTYETTGAPYTATTFASRFESAFIDSGLMTAWFDSFTNGALVHRVLEIVYDGSKALGKTYYWFIFSGANVFVQITNGWNAGSDVPSGTQYNDFLSNLTNTTANHLRLSPSFNASVTASITRYTSAIRTGFTWFYVRNGSLDFNFFIDKTAPRSSVVDLAKVSYSSMMWGRTRVSGNTGVVNFQFFPMKLRKHFLGAGLRGITAIAEYGANDTATAPWETGSSANTFLSSIAYGFVGNGSASANNYNLLGGNAQNVTFLNIGFPNTNDNYSAVYTPPFTDVLFSNYSDATLPADFCIGGTFTANNLTTLNLVIVSAGVEEYQIISVANGSTLNDSVTVFIGARTV